MPKPFFPLLFIPDAIIDKDFLPKTHPIKPNENPKLGASEVEFGALLKFHFVPCVHPQMELLPPGHDRPYSADFLMVEPITGLHIDLEIDEPFSFATKEPTHAVGMDDYRNKCFVEANWVVLRFAEEQIKSQPVRCLRMLANVIAKYTGNSQWQNSFADASQVTPISGQAHLIWYNVNLTNQTK
jgi:hypothetical protein